MGLFTSQNMSFGRNTARKYGLDAMGNGVKRYDVSGVPERIASTTGRPKPS